MGTTSLRNLAQHLDVPERTLRRAAAEGLIRGERTSPRRFRASLREEAFCGGAAQRALGNVEVLCEVA